MAFYRRSNGGKLSAGFSPDSEERQQGSMASQHDLDEIQRRAKEVWSSPDKGPTTYQNHFDDKYLIADEIAKSRPTSATRRNKPHPSLPFMTCRLHAVPGFFNADATLGKATYQVDSLVSPQVRSARTQLRSKYESALSAGAMRQYEPNNVQLDVEPITKGLYSDNPFEVTQLPKMKNYQEKDITLQPRTNEVASIYRYLRPAGFEERSNIYKIIRNSQGSNPKNIDEMKMADLERRKNTRYVHRSKRGDFLLHPDWPPSLPHHRLNGLSSVELPYSSGRR